MGLSLLPELLVLWPLGFEHTCQVEEGQYSFVQVNCQSSKHGVHFII